MDGRVLGDYTIIKQIGQGSLGDVYLAEHRFMKRHFALKILPEELATDRAFIQRFEEEVRRLATLEHPHIVKIHNVSSVQGVYFLVTDCIVDSINETTNLAQYATAKGGRFKEEEVLSFLRQIADALDYAHGKKGGEGAIVHRGLKLNNILVGKGRQGAEVYISDFGLSKVVGIGAVLSRTYMALAEALTIAEGGVQGRRVQDGYNATAVDTQKLSALHTSFLQNYAFLAPEQKRLNDSRGVDAKADVYAFGVLAYYLLTREYPEGLFEMPSKKVPEYRLNWDALITQCLQPNPAKRPIQLLDALDEVDQEHEAPAAIAAPVLPPIQAKPVRLKWKPPVQADETLPKAQPLSSMVFKKVEMQETATAVAVKSAEPTQEQAKNSTARPAAPSTIEEFLTRPEPTVTAYHPERKATRKIEPIMTDMVLIQHGSFWRGSNDGNRDEMPRHQVTLDNFAIDIHPVSNEQFILFLEYMGGEKDPQNHDTILLRDSRIRRSAGKLIIESGYTKHPVVGVTWYGAVAYAAWVGKRLPTEAEWEVASRGGLDSIAYPTGESIEKSQANFFSSDTTPVMSYAPNGFGIYDVAGNVYEWCQDWYSYNYYETSAQEPNNPPGPLQGVYRVLRGGCWKSLAEDLRCSHRHRNNPGNVNSTYGFRCAATVE